MEQSIAHAASFLDSWLAYRAAYAHDVVGYSVAVLYKGKMVFSRAYGLADIQAATPMTTQHLFNMASQTKMMTAALCLQLSEQGRLKLDEPASDYTSWLREHRDPAFRKITIRHLLSHTSGLPREGQKADFWLFKTQFPTRAQFKQAVLQTPLIFSPGTHVKYSNMGYGILGSVLEEITGKPFTHLVNNSFIKPLKLNAAPDYSQKLSHKIPTGYSLPHHHNRTPLRPRLNTRAMAPATGLYATPEAMCRFVAEFFNGNERILNATSKKEMRKKQSSLRSGYDEGIAFGLGQEIQFVNDKRLTGHTGHAGCHTSATFFDPKKRLAIAVAANAKDSAVTSMARGIWGILDYFMQHEKKSRDVLLNSRPFSARLINETSTVEIVHVGEKIVIIDPDDWEPFGWCEELTKVDERTLRFITPGSAYNEGELLRYAFGQDGRAESVNLAGFTLRPENKKSTLATKNTPI